MSNRERFSGSLRRTINRHDQVLHRQTQERDFSGQEDGRESYQELCRQLNSVMQRYFPDQFTRFTPPSLEVTRSKLNQIAQLFGQPADSDFFDRSFIAGAAVRYVDNFIDEALWPAFKERLAAGGNLDEVEPRFHAFLVAIYAVVLKHEPYMPAEILELPKIELHMLLHPDQQTFDENIQPYVFGKSFNLAYMEHLFTQQRSAESALWTKPERARFQLLAAWDTARDLSTTEISDDFDIFQHIRKHQLDPSRLIELVRQIIHDNIAQADLSPVEQQGLNDCRKMIDYLNRIHTPQVESA